LLEAQLALVEQGAIGVVRRDHDELRAVEADVALEQRQHAAADRSEADHDDRTSEGRVQELAVGRADTGVHGLISESEASQAASITGARFAPVRKSGRPFGKRSPVARIRPRAPSSAPAFSSIPSRRSGSNGPGSRNAPVLAAEKPNR